MKRYTNGMSINTISLHSEENILNYKKNPKQSLKKDDIPVNKLEKCNYNVSMKNIKVSDHKNYLSTASKNFSLTNIKSSIRRDTNYKLEKSGSVLSNGISSEMSTRIRVIARFRPVNSIEQVYFIN